jgi:hypothetical protein
VGLDLSENSLDAKAPGLRHPLCLEEGTLDTDVRIETTPGGGYGIGRHDSIRSKTILDTIVMKALFDRINQFF